MIELKIGTVTSRVTVRKADSSFVILYLYGYFMRGFFSFFFSFSFYEFDVYLCVCRSNWYTIRCRASKLFSSSNFFLSCARSVGWRVSAIALRRSSQCYWLVYSLRILKTYIFPISEVLFISWLGSSHSRGPDNQLLRHV